LPKAQRFVLAPLLLFTGLPTNSRLVWRSIRLFGSRIDKIADPALRKQVARNGLHVVSSIPI
jgi:hypothetical protein